MILDVDIARSGAYNRTLTPFGFQSEQRNYWDVPEIYNGMSPFMNANKMKKPIAFGFTVKQITILYIYTSNRALFPSVEKLEEHL